MKTASIESANHIRSVINPLVRQDVDSSTACVAWQIWVEAVTGIPFSRLSDWRSDIEYEAWLHDRTVSNALKKFCDATHETARYEPFSEIANYVLEKAKGRLKGVPEEYPISDIKFFRNDPTYLQCYEKHGVLGARRKPDVLCLREPAARTIERGRGRSPPGAEWSSVILFAEFKFDKKTDVHALLKGALEKRSRVNSDARVEPLKGKKRVTGRKRGQSRRKPEPATSLDTKDPNDIYPAEHSSGPSSTKQGRKRLHDEMDAEDDQIHNVSKKNRTPGGMSRAEPVEQENEVAIQAASYALEVLSCTSGTRVYTLGLVFKDDELTLWYYDASGLVKTLEPLSLISNFAEVTAVLIALACCDASQLGALPVLRPPEDTPYPIGFPHSDLSGFMVYLRHPNSHDDVKITLGDPIFCQYALVGRRTFVYEATSTHEALRDRVFVVKFSQQIKTRRSEHAVLQIANDAGVNNLPEFLFSDDIWSLSDGPRSVFHKNMLGSQYDDRVLRAIVCQRYVPLQKVLLEHPEYLKIMVRQMLQCLHDLRYKANILHRDISVNNIMFEMRDGEPCFILNDFDLATVVTQQGEHTGATLKHRTGTLPFMAYELIRDMCRPTPWGTTHSLRHDFESLYCATIWCCSRIEPVDSPHLRAHIEFETLAWETGTFTSIANAKYSFLALGSRLDEWPITPRFAQYRDFLQDWHSIHAEAMRVISVHEEKVRRHKAHGITVDATLDGIVSLKNIFEALDIEHSPARADPGSEFSELEELCLATADGTANASSLVICEPPVTRTFEDTIVAPCDFALSEDIRSSNSAASPEHPMHGAGNSSFLSLLQWLRLPTSLFASN